MAESLVGVSPDVIDGVLDLRNVEERSSNGKVPEVLIRVIARTAGRQSDAGADNQLGSCFLQVVGETVQLAVIGPREVAVQIVRGLCGSCPAEWCRSASS